MLSSDRDESSESEYCRTPSKFSLQSTQKFASIYVRLSRLVVNVDDAAAAVETLSRRGNGAFTSEMDT